MYFRQHAEPQLGHLPVHTRCQSREKLHDRDLRAKPPEPGFLDPEREPMGHFSEAESVLAPGMSIISRARIRDFRAAGCGLIWTT